MYCPPTLGDVRRAKAATRVAATTQRAQRQPTRVAPKTLPTRQAVAPAAMRATAAQQARTQAVSQSRQRAAVTTATQQAGKTRARLAVTRLAAQVATPHRQPRVPGREEVQRAQQVLRTPATGRTATAQRTAARTVLRRAKNSGVTVLPGVETVLRDASASGPITNAVVRTARRQAARMDTSTGQSSTPAVEARTAPTPTEAAQAAAFGTGQPDANVTAEAAAARSEGGVGALLSNPMIWAGAAVVAFLLMKRGR